jgi:hypothetical protein
MNRIYKNILLLSFITLSTTETSGDLKDVTFSDTKAIKNKEESSSQKYDLSWLEKQQKNFEEVLKTLPKEFRDDPIAYLTKKVKDTVTTFDQVSTHFKDAGKNN